MLTLAQFETREDAVFAALRSLAKYHGSGVADFEIEDNESFTVLSGSKHVSGSFRFEQNEPLSDSRLLARLACRADRTSTVARLSITYRAEAPATFPFIYANGTAEYKDRASLTQEQRKIISDNLHPYLYAPESLNYYGSLMVFKTPQGFDAAFDVILEHIDELDLGSVITLIGRRQSRTEQLWPKPEEG